MRNPFTPTFGTVPLYLAGRDDVLDIMKKAFIDWQGNPNLSTILIGPRGSGKTAMLSCIGDKAREEGWIVVDTVASEGMLDDILQRVLDAASERQEPKRKKLTGISLGNIIGLTWQAGEEIKANWRSKLTVLLRKLNAHDVGLLITVDEVAAEEEMIRLASVYQLLIREGAKVSLVMAGLPSRVGSLVTNERVSFLRRATQRYLSNISDVDVRNAFSKTIESEGRKIDYEGLDKAVKATGGFAYMMQLVGYHIWESAGMNPIIGMEDVERGILLAKQSFRDGVLNSTFLELSRGDVAFLNAMLPDENVSRVSDIAKRIGKSPGYVSTYKKRLMQAGVVEEAPKGTVKFAIPFFRDYLEEMNR